MGNYHPSIDSFTKSPETRTMETSKAQSSAKNQLLNMSETALSNSWNQPTLKKALQTTFDDHWNKPPESTVKAHSDSWSKPLKPEVSQTSDSLSEPSWPVPSRILGDSSEKSPKKTDTSWGGPELQKKPSSTWDQSPSSTSQANVVDSWGSEISTPIEPFNGSENWMKKAAQFESQLTNEKQNAAEPAENFGNGKANGKKGESQFTISNLESRGGAGNDFSDYEPYGTESNRSFGGDSGCRRCGKKVIFDISFCC